MILEFPPYRNPLKSRHPPEELVFRGMSVV